MAGCYNGTIAYTRSGTNKKRALKTSRGTSPKSKPVMTAQTPLPFRCHCGVRNGPFLSSGAQTHDSRNVREVVELLRVTW